MSASNWAVCPACLKAQDDLAKLLAKKAEDAYGTVTVAEFDAMRATAEQAAEAALNLRATFREDYEIYGAVAGTVVVDYSGHCTECDLGVDFKDEHPIPGVNDV
jgi:predicted DsbA family dithiol-disulfide isomerase